MNYDRMMLLVVDDYARQFDLPPVLVEAMIAVESGGNALAWQPGSTRRATPRDSDSEWYGRRCRWGPMLLLGMVARERGFTGSFPALCNMDCGVYWGCRQLAWLDRHYGVHHGWRGVIGAWREGSLPQGKEEIKHRGYVRQVIEAMSVLAERQTEDNERRRLEQAT